MNKLFVILLLCCSTYVFSQTKHTHDVYFETDEYLITQAEENQLLLFINSLKKHTINSISIFGFCDDVGAASYNLKLSQQRANTVKNIFTSHQIKDNLINNVDGKGEISLKIIDKNNTNTTRGLNRKVKIIAYTSEENHAKNQLSETKNAPSDKIKGQLEIGDKIVFNNILFKTGYSQIIPESEATLDSIAHALLNRNDIYFTIQGHVCCTPYSRDAIDKATNERNLSLARAKYVYEYFAKKGIDKKRMRYLGMRRKFPLGGDPKFDRRVEILITYVGD